MQSAISLSFVDSSSNTERGIHEENYPSGVFATMKTCIIFYCILFFSLIFSSNEARAAVISSSAADSDQTFWFKLQEKSDPVGNFVVARGGVAVPRGNYSFEYQHWFVPPAPVAWNVKELHPKPARASWVPFVKAASESSPAPGPGILPRAESRWSVENFVDPLFGSLNVKVNTKAVAEAGGGFPNEAHSRTRVVDPWDFYREWSGASSLIGGFDLTGAISGDGQVGSNFYLSKNGQSEHQLLFSINITSATASVEAMDGVSFFLNNDQLVNEYPVSKSELTQILKTFHTDDGWLMSDLNSFRLNFRYDIDSSWELATVYTENYSFASVPEPSSCILCFSGITLMVVGKFGRKNLLFRNPCG